MEVIALAISLDPILVRGKQLVDQFRTWRGNKQNAAQLIDAFNTFETDLAQCITGLQTESAKLPHHSRELIQNDITTLTTCLTIVRATLQNVIRSLKRNPFLQFMRAHVVAKDCDTLATKLEEARTLLNNADKHVDLRAAIHRIETGQNQTPMDSFRRFFPPLSSSVRAVLDFDSRDEIGKPMTIEGLVKQLLLEEKSDSVGVVSILGIGGVGKSTILRALSVDDQIRHRFPDGIHMIKLGKNASSATLFRQLCQILKDSGAEKTYKSLSIQNNMASLLHFFETWFNGKRCAFLIDDVWSHEVDLSLFSRLSDICSATGNSILLTTREYEIASIAPREKIIRLDPREARGPEARRILIFHAGKQETDPSSTLVNDSINRILDICDGLPVSLVAAGKNVRMMSIDLLSDHDFVWKQYASELEICRDRLLRENVDSYGNLFATFETSISILDKHPREETLGFTSALSFAEMYRRFCVLQKQATVPISMLQQLWETESVEHANMIARRFVECGMANREAVRFGGGYVWHLSLHDSLHDFAVAEAKRECDSKKAHECLLKGYKSLDPEISCKRRGTSRWWSRKLERDGYIHGNLCRHMLGAEHIKELIQLLLSPQWVRRQLEVNDVLYVESDFGFGMSAVDKMKDISSDEVCVVKEALQLISEAVTLSSGFLSSNATEIWFQLQGRLKRYCECNKEIREYVTWIEAKAARPLIVCKTSFLREPGTANARMVFVDSDVCCMVVLRDEERIGCGCDDGRIFVVNLKTSVVENQWKAHDDMVSAIAFGGDGTQLVSGSWDNTAKVWEIETSRLVTCFNLHTDDVNGIAMMKDGKRVFSVSDDGAAMMWNLETGQILSKPFTCHESRIQCFAVLGNEEELVVTGGSDRNVRIWSLRTGEQMGDALNGHDDWVRCVTVTPDGQYILSGSDDKTIRIWDIRSRLQIGNALEGHTDAVTCMAVSEDGRRLVSGSADNTIRMWDLESGEEICHPLKGHTDAIYGVSFLGGVHCTVSCSWDRTIRVWDVTRRSAETLTSRHKHVVSSVSFTPDGRYVVSGSWDKTLRAWNTNSGQQVGNALEGHSDSVNDVAVTPNGRYIVSVSDDKRVIVWDLESHELLHTLTCPSEIECLAVTPQGDHVVTGSHDGIVRVWDLIAMDGGHLVLEGHSAYVLKVFISDDGLRVISVDEVGNILVWELETKKLVKQFIKVAAWKLSRKEILNVISETTVHSDTTLSIPLAGRQIIDCNGLDDTVLATMESAIWSWALSPDKKTICAGLSDGQVALMKLET